MKTYDQIKRERDIYVETCCEGHDNGMFDEQLAEALQREIEVDEEAERSEWTQEVTIARRAQWNDIVRTYARIGVKELAEIEKTVGFRMCTLKTAILRHSL